MSRLVARQLGHISRVQLLGLGVSPEVIRGRLQRGDLIAVHAGVYAIGHVPRHAHCRAVAAVLACGDGAALSHAAAAALWDVLDWPATLEVTAPRQHRRPGLTTHRSKTRTRRDVRTRHGVRVTSPARTVVDLQPRLSDARLQRVTNDLRIAGHLNATAFTELCSRSARVDALLGDGDGDGRPGRATRSGLEDRFRAFVTRHRLPMPEVNAILDPITRREVDALYRAQRLIVEIDSWEFHRDRAAFERDRAKDARALAAGYTTLRITDRRLTRGGAEEAATIRRILANAQYRPSPRA
jgi:very-short-patch-repair endonuclease